MEVFPRDIPPLGGILSFLAVFADSVNWSKSDISLPVFGVALDEESYAIPQREPHPGSSFQITAVESIAITDRSFWRTMETVMCPPLPRMVALKIPYREDDHDVDAKMNACLASLVKEVRILRNSYLRSHENIVSLLGVCWRSWDVQDGIQHVAPVLILELADEGDLAGFLSNHESIDVFLQISLALDLCAGLQALHDVGVAHCDFKPNNCLVFRKEGSWVAKISDFGSAKWTDLTEPGLQEGLEGTAAWRGPTRQQYQTLQDMMSGDVYSLTLAIWSILTMGNGGSFIVDSDPNELESLKLDGTLVAMVNQDFTKWLEHFGIGLASFKEEGNSLVMGMQVEAEATAVKPTDLIRVMRRVVEHLEYEDPDMACQPRIESEIPPQDDEGMAPIEKSSGSQRTTITNESGDVVASNLLDAMSSLQIQSPPTNADNPEQRVTSESENLREIDRL